MTALKAAFSRLFRLILSESCASSVLSRDKTAGYRWHTQGAESVSFQCIGFHPASSLLDFCSAVTASLAWRDRWRLLEVLLLSGIWCCWSRQSTRSSSADSCRVLILDDEDQSRHLYFLLTLQMLKYLAFQPLISSFFALGCSFCSCQSLANIHECLFYSLFWII